MSIHIENVPEAKGEDLLKVINSLEAFNDQHAAQEYQRRVIRLFARNEEGEIMGGLFAAVTMGWMAIQILWLDERLRGQGIGKRLLGEAESLARESEAIGAYVETTNFQARPFYEEMGYEVFSELKDCPPGDTTFFLKKRWS